MAAPCPYRELGLGRGASAREVKAAFRRAALETHPDRQPPGEGAAAAARRAAAFRRVTEAYEVLRDPVLRARLDRGERAPAGRHPHAWGDPAASARSARPRRPPPTGYEALWNRLARQVARRPRVSALEGAALAAAAAAALAGLSALDRGADALWATHNRGKSFEDIPKRRGAR